MGGCGTVASGGTTYCGTTYCGTTYCGTTYCGTTCCSHTTYCGTTYCGGRPTSPTDVSRRSTRPGGGAGMLPMYLPPRRRRTSRRLRCWPTTWACSLCSASPRACPKQRTPSPRPPEVLADAPGEASPPLHVTPPPVGRGIVNESAVGWISLPVPLLIAIGAHTLRTQLCPSLKLPQSATRLPLTRTAPRARAPHRGRGRGRGDVRTALLR
jgi:hypothetical protein